LEDILQEQGSIQITCEFCGKQYLFDRVDVETLLSQDSVTHPSETLH
jgi:molecular chaperone Hsp33